MAKYSWVQTVKQYPLEQYQQSIQDVVNFLKQHKEVVSIYRIGNITDPGISDVDMLVVFKDDAQFNKDPRVVLDEAGNYLFTHGLFACQEKHLAGLNRFSFVHNNQFLWGKEQGNLSNVDAMHPVIQKSLALEFLVKMYLTLSVQKSLRVVKLRSLLLEAKAVKFDLDIFNYGSTRLLELVKQVIVWRGQWFDKRPDEKELSLFFEAFHTELEQFLNFLAKEHELFSLKGCHSISKNIVLEQGGQLEFIAKLPPFTFLKPLFKNRELLWFKMINKLSSYKLRFPIGTSDKALLQERDDFFSQYLLDIQNSSPHFLALKSSLNLDFSKAHSS